MTDVTSTIQMAVIGVGWFDITDVKSRAGIMARRGILGGTPYDRVASVGRLEFSLDNSTHNSGGLEGYYSPDHANKRANFGVGTLIRWKLESGATARYKFYGILVNIQPEPGKYAIHDSAIAVEDSMANLLNGKVAGGISVEINKRTSQIIPNVISDLVLPLDGSISFESTPDIFPSALDDLADENVPAMTAIQKLCQSDGSYLYVTSNAVFGAVLKLTSRNTRSIASSVDASLSDTMVGVKIVHGTDLIYNKVTCAISSRRVDGTAAILWSNPDELTLAPMQSVVLTARFTDPSGQAERVTLYPSSQVTPVANTDYRMSSVTNNSGSDLNSSLSISVVWGLGSAVITLQNTNTSSAGYVNLLQLRGKGIYLYSKQNAEVSDAASIALYGERPLTYNLAYQSNLNVAYDIANSLLGRYKDPVTHVSAVEFLANKSDTLMGYALTLDIGARIYLSETVTGLAGYYFINSVEYRLEDGKFLRVTWGLVPANTHSVWILGDSVNSVLGSTTIPTLYI